jgi:hypothetical protein
MRIQVAGSPLAGRLLALTAGVVLALGLSVGGAAWAAPIPERTYSESSAPAAPVVAERSYSDAPVVAETPAPAPAESVAVVSPPDDGMSAFVIALIAFGGVVALGGLAFLGVRVAHHGHAAH